MTGDPDDPGDGWNIPGTDDETILPPPPEDWQREHGWKNGKPPPPEDKPKPNGKAEDHSDEVQIVRAPITEISEIPPRPWAYGRFMLFGSAAVIGAVDGSGKGVIAVAMALSFITGKPLLGERVWRSGPVAIISYEDDIDEWRRRIAAACMHYNLDYKTILLNVHFLTKLDGRVVLAQRTHDELVFPDSARIVQLLNSVGAVALFVDPFNNAHAMEDGNNNVAIAAVAAEVTRIARVANVTALVLHHLRKGSIGNVDDLMGAVALRANFRACRILALMIGAEAEKLGVDEPWRYLRVAGTKANYAPPLDRSVWFKLVSVALGNAAGVYMHGDTMGVATSWEPPPMFEGMDYAPLRAVFNALKATLHGQNKQVRTIPWAGTPLIELAARTEVQAEKILAAWLQNGVLVEGEPVKAKNRSTDIKTVALDPSKAAEILAQHAPPGYADES